MKDREKLRNSWISTGQRLKIIVGISVHLQPSETPRKMCVFSAIFGQNCYIPRGKYFVRACRVGFNVPIKKRLIHSLHTEKEFLKRELCEQNLTLLKLCQLNTGFWTN